MSLAYENALTAADFIRSRFGLSPEIGIILGTNLGSLSDRIQNRTEIPYGEIPHFLVSTAPSHAGKLILGSLAGKTVVCMSGRFHHYEGYSYEELSIPVRVLRCLGVKALILTNAAGAINTSYHPGDIMIIQDHIKLFGDSPLTGENAGEFGPRFPDMTRAYTPSLRKLAKECAASVPLTVHEGVYFFFPGPQFESPGEIRAARALGGDAAGMSTAPEAITAAHCGMPLLGLSMMVNMAAGVSPDPITGEEIDRITSSVLEPFSDYLELIVSKMEV